MPKNANDTKKSGPSPAFRKAKERAEEYRKKYYGKMKEAREQKLPNAALMSTGTLVGAAPTGIVVGLVPETYQPEGWNTPIPTRLITEALATLTGVVVAGGSFALGFEYPIHIGAGMTGSGGAFLLKRGTEYVRAKSMEWYEEQRAAA